MFLRRRIPVSRTTPTLPQILGRTRIQLSRPCIPTNSSTFSTLPQYETPARIHTESRASSSKVTIEDTTPSYTLSDLQRNIYTAYSEQSYETADAWVQKLVEQHHLSPDDSLAALHKILGSDLATHLQPKTLHSIYNLIRSSPQELNKLSPPVLIRILKTLQGPDIDVVLPLLIHHLAEYRPPMGIDSLDYRPPTEIFEAMAMIPVLLEKRLDDALNLFSVLIENGHISADNLPQEQVEDPDELKFMVIGALVEASLHWDQSLLAAQFLFSYLPSCKSTDERVGLLVTQTVTTILEVAVSVNPKKYLEACSTLIQNAHPVCPVPDSLIQQFYATAESYNEGESAENLYHFSRSVEESAHHYPPPHENTLGWFMNYLGRIARYPFLIRLLATEVLEKDIPIPALSRAKFIDITARNGNAGLAKDLWIKYANRSDGHFIRGNPALFMAMVRLYVQLITTLEKKRRVLESENRNTLTKEMGKRGVEELKRLRKDIPAARSFLDTVMRRFKEQYRDLSRAHHVALTTYARACMLTGREKEGFEVLETLFERQEVPDIYDVNVALSGLGKSDPMAAYGLLQGMQKRGVVPDATSYGTVLNCAVSKGNFELADKMAHELEQMDIRRFNISTLSALLKGYGFQRPTDDTVIYRKRLERALEIAQIWRKRNKQSSSQIGWLMVRRALRTGDARLAYGFWDTFLREGERWNDGQHVQMRKKIGEMICVEIRVGRLEREEGLRMGSTLSVNFGR